MELLLFVKCFAINRVQITDIATSTTTTKKNPNNSQQTPYHKKNNPKQNPRPDFQDLMSS